MPVYLRRRLVELDQMGRVQRQVLGMVTQVPWDPKGSVSPRMNKPCGNGLYHLENWWFEGWIIIIIIIIIGLPTLPKKKDQWIVNIKRRLIHLLFPRSLMLTDTQLVVGESTQIAHVFAEGCWNE